MTKGMTKEVIARYTSSGHKFEILVDSEKVQRYKEKQDVPIRDIMIGDHIFTDLSKAESVKDDLLLRVFKTDDVLKVAEHIIRHGEIQLTTEQRKDALEKKRNKIIAYISKHAVDPRTKLPHPPQRIENAFAEAKIRIDPFARAEDQIKDIIKQIRPILPLSIEDKIVAFRIPVNYAGATRNAISRLGNILKDEWSGQYWFVEIEVPAGMVDELFGEVNSITHGENESKIISSKNHD
ncbi:MAG: ribosome assembly factor SBDS [archaeon]